MFVFPQSGPYSPVETRASQFGKEIRNLVQSNPPALAARAMLKVGPGYKWVEHGFN